MFEMHNKFPILHIGKYRLRALEATDVSDFYSFITHPNVKEFLADDDVPRDMFAAEQELNYWAGLYKHGSSIYWCIANEEDKLIGTCGFNYWNRMHHRVEVSYDLNHEYWGKGIATSAVQAITKFALEKMDVNRIQATVAVDNIGSIRVLEKSGFSREGTLAKFCVIHGVVKDYYMYSLCK